MRKQEKTEARVIIIEATEQEGGILAWTFGEGGPSEYRAGVMGLREHHLPGFLEDVINDIKMSIKDEELS